jgi:geranylgeranyl pyrophosphate synthase
LKTPVEAENAFAAWRQHFETALDRFLPPPGTEPVVLHQAMRYSALSGGKRLRPFLIYAAGQSLGLELSSLDTIACAVELIHAYSLIHDDLPAMDNDDLRRGIATCHLAFDEATAILAGDALQALAFRTIVTDPDIPAGISVRLVGDLAEACGSAGMAGGQMLDLEVTGKGADIGQLERIHRLKTGALIRFSVLAPGKIAQSDSQTLYALGRYGECVGLGFQIRDDILDVTGDAASLGKNPHADATLNKPTYPTLIGLEASRQRAQALRDEALKALEQINGDTQALTWLADHIVSRDR